MLRNGNVIVILMVNENFLIFIFFINNVVRDICFNRKEGKVNYSILNCFSLYMWKISNVFN